MAPKSCYKENKMCEKSSFNFRNWKKLQRQFKSGEIQDIYNKKEIQNNCNNHLKTCHYFIIKSNKKKVQVTFTFQQNTKGNTQN